MHEYSVISALFDLCFEETKKHNKSRILRAKIEVGERSGVEVELLKSAFEVFKNESEASKDCALEIVRKPVILHCANCKKDFSARGLEYGVCPHCASSEVRIIEGTELRLLSIEME